MRQGAAFCWIGNAAPGVVAITTPPTTVGRLRCGASHAGAAAVADSAVPSPMDPSTGYITPSGGSQRLERSRSAPGGPGLLFY